FEVTEAIRNHIATSHIPLILLTAKASLENRLEGLRRGADAYLTKPFSPEELALRIKKLIELRKLLQQRYQDRDTPPEKNTEFEKEDGFISELKRYILDNISEPDLDVKTISRHFAISRIQLYRKLKALIDKPIADYVRSVRLEKALDLLNENRLNITEIAYEIGFSSVSNFSKAFKKAYGRSPSAIK
ncbi:MAG: helix-turn-helix domain-containing protein, partial [Sinomicrobium sp.]|nr:helix-turn-helix domain-containing protein [Sinomicrobium sp.]